MAAYIIWQVRVRDREAMERYKERAWATLAPYDVEAVMADDAPAVLEGEWFGPRTFVLRFGDHEQARAWYDGEAYQAVLPLRQGAADCNVVLVAGAD